MSDDYTPKRQRTQIVTAVAARVDALFNSAEGTSAKWLRKVERGPLRPMSSMYPAAIVRDGGQRRLPGREDEESTNRVLSIDLVLYLAGSWEDVNTDEEITDLVDLLIWEMEGYCPPHGVMRMDYVSDDRPDVLWMSGGSNALWSLRFEAQYFAERQVRSNR